MNEGSFTAAVNAQVRGLGTYVWKISDRFTAGVSDAWYRGGKGSLFIEYKWSKNRPKDVARFLDKAVSALQRKWLRECQADEQKVAVVLGCEGYIAVSLDMENLSPAFEFNTREQLAEWIHEQCGSSTSITAPPSSRRLSRSKVGVSKPTPKNRPHFPTPKLL